VVFEKAAAEEESQIEKSSEKAAIEVDSYEQTASPSEQSK